MTTHERRQHFRIDDCIYFDYRILNSGEINFEQSIITQLLGDHGRQFLESRLYLEDIDHQVDELIQKISKEDNKVAECLYLLNNKIDFISSQISISDKIHLKPVNLSLGGMSFYTKDRLQKKALLKIVIYTKPKMIPIVLDAQVVYSSQAIGEKKYRTAVEFYDLNPKSEQLLAQHIMLAQTALNSD